MSELGNRPVGSTVVFNTTFSVNGVPTDFDSAPTVSIYKNSVDPNTSGVTLTQNYDGLTGMLHVVIDTSADGSFYAAENDFSVVVTAGALSGVSMIGYVIGSFQLTTERTNLDKTTNAIPRGTVTTGASTTSVPTSAFTIANAAASGVLADQFKDGVIFFDGNTTTAGLRGVKKAISASTASNTPTLTVGTLPATPVSGDTFSIL